MLSYDPAAGTAAVAWVVGSLTGALGDGSDPVLSFLACPEALLDRSTIWLFWERLEQTSED